MYKKEIFLGIKQSSLPSPNLPNLLSSLNSLNTRQIRRRESQKFGGSLVFANSSTRTKTANIWRVLEFAKFAGEWPLLKLIPHLTQLLNIVVPLFRTWNEVRCPWCKRWSKNRCVIASKSKSKLAKYLRWRKCREKTNRESKPSRLKRDSKKMRSEERRRKFLHSGKTKCASHSPLHIRQHSHCQLFINRFDEKY